MYLVFKVPKQIRLNNQIEKPALIILFIPTINKILKLIFAKPIKYIKISYF